MNYSYKSLWLINYPVMMSVLMEQLLNITDAIFLGHVGEVELGASAIAGIYYLTLYMLGFGFSLGLQVVIARRNGEQNYSKTGLTFFQGLWCLLLLAIFLFGMSKIASSYIISPLVHSDEVYNAIMIYTDWRTLGLLYALPALAFRAFFVGTTNTSMLTLNAIAMVASNILLNYILIFGGFGVKALGIQGAAIASSLSELISLTLFVSYALLKLDKEKYGFKPAFEWKAIINLWKISVWSMLHSFISVAPWFLFFISVEHLGKNQLAIANIMRSISSLFFVIVSSFASTTASLVSNLMGKKEYNEVKPLCLKIIRLGYAIGIPLIILAFIFHNPLIGIYTTNKGLIHAGFWPFVVMISNYIVALPSYVYLNTVTGIGATRMAFVFQVITIAFYLAYLYLLNTFSDVPLAVYMTVEHLFVILLLTFSIIYLKNSNWKQSEI